MSAGGGDKPKKPRNVGYKNPPVESQFPKGKSGNPKGRPRGSKNKSKGLESQLFKAIDKEANRIISIQENGKPVKLTVAETIVRVMSGKAIQGNHQSTKLMFSLMEAGETKTIEETNTLARNAYAYKRDVSAYIKDCKKHKRPFEMPIPHPDHVHIDDDTLEVTIEGPKDLKALGYWKVVIFNIARMEVESMLHCNADTWINKAMAWTPADAEPRQCEHMIAKLNSGQEPVCDDDECRAEAFFLEDDSFTMKYYKGFRENVPFDDPFWLEYGPGYKRKHIDHYFYYGPDFWIPELDLITQGRMNPNAREFTHEEHLSLSKSKKTRASFEEFMREKLCEEMGIDWHLRLDAGFHFKRDIGFDKMRFEYEMGTFDPDNYVFNDGEDILFQDEGFLEHYMSWAPEEERNAEIIAYLEDTLKAL